MCISLVRDCDALCTVRLCSYWASCTEKIATIAALPSTSPYYDSPCSDVHREVAHHADTHRKRCSDRTFRASRAEAHHRPPSWWVGAYCDECGGLREAQAPVDVSRMIHALHLPYICSLLMLFAPLLIGAPIGHSTNGLALCVSTSADALV